MGCEGEGERERKEGWEWGKGKGKEAKFQENQGIGREKKGFVRLSKGMTMTPWGKKRGEWKSSERRKFESWERKWKWTGWNGWTEWTEWSQVSHQSSGGKDSQVSQYSVLRRFGPLGQFRTDLLALPVCQVSLPSQY